ncbi:MAG: hypothetical protein U1E16_04810 [Hyphomicrobiales bacterium]
MLQQTTVQAVKAYFEKFTGLWPTVEALAAAPATTCSRPGRGSAITPAPATSTCLCEGSRPALRRQVPADRGGTARSPASAPTAGAIAAIAFGGRHAAVDGNVERVINPPPSRRRCRRSKPEIRDRAQALVPERRAGDFAQAMMDLGATICTPAPAQLPHLSVDGALPRPHHRPGPALPRKAPKRRVPTRRGVAFWISRQDGAVLLRRRRRRACSAA